MMLVCDTGLSDLPVSQSNPCYANTLPPPQVLADAVSRLVVDRFSELTENFTSPHARRKVLAGVVMTTGSALCFVGFLSLGTFFVNLIDNKTHLYTPVSSVFCLSQC